ncbi:MAG: hypothetical protein PHV68_03725 [Candidatus Gastranaerophilales bacterium]|nr:hypothetical protein [Candidatus Gastranaerophilales bacterium]
MSKLLYEQRKLKKKWKEKFSPKQLGKGSGWVKELNKAYTDGKFAVMSRPVQTEWGEVIHVCIRNADNTDIAWADKQRIKNELFGTFKTAIEVFPSEFNLVDEANMYHLWILPENFKLPFSL